MEFAKELVDPIGAFRPWPVRQMLWAPGNVRPGEAELSRIESAVDAKWSLLDVYGQACSIAIERCRDELGQLYNSILGFAMGAWHLCGRQSVSVAPNLVEALVNTSLEQVPSGVVRPPHPAVWIELTSPLNERLSLRGLFVLSGVVGEDALYDAPEVLPTRVPGAVTGTTALTMCGVTSLDALVTSHLYLVKTTLEECLELACRSHDSGVTSSGGPILIMAGEPVEQLREIWRFVSNVFMYLTSPHPDFQRIVPAGLERVPRRRKSWERSADERATFRTWAID